MEFGNVVLCIINLLFVPLIALHYYCRRINQKFELSPENVYRYALISTLNLLATEFVIVLLEKFMSSTYEITTGGQLGAVFPVITLFTQFGESVFSCPVSSRLYTLLALISSFILVLFLELLRKTTSIDISIEKKQRKNKRARKAETVVENETKD